MKMKVYDVEVSVGAYPGKGERVYHVYLSADTTTRPAVIEKEAEDYVKANADWQQRPSGMGSQVEIQPPVITVRQVTELKKIFVFEGKVDVEKDGLPLLKHI